MKTANSLLFKVGTGDNCKGLFTDVPLFTTVKALALLWQCILPTNRLLKLPQLGSLRVFCCWICRLGGGPARLYSPTWGGLEGLPHFYQTLLLKQSMQGNDYRNDGIEDVKLTGQNYQLLEQTMDLPYEFELGKQLQS